LREWREGREGGGLSTDVEGKKENSRRMKIRKRAGVEKHMITINSGTRTSDCSEEQVSTEETKGAKEKKTNENLKVHQASIKHPQRHSSVPHLSQSLRAS
jgi:hypothetical protein